MLPGFKQWWKEDKAVVAVEVGLLMPLMLVLMLGSVDIGVWILLDQKVLNADQMVADLLTRNPTVSTTDLTNAIEAGKLTIQPYSTASYAVDIAGVQFVGGPTQPQVIWRYTTVNGVANPDVPADANNLGADQEGVIVVTVTYTFIPPFLGVLANASYKMKEVAFARGRNGLFIPKV